MVVTVKLFATFQKGRFDVAPQEFPPGTKLSDVLDALRLPKEELGVALVNGRHAFMDYQLAPGDTLSLFPLLGGG